MYLQYYMNEKGEKVHTTKESPLGVPTQSAHPARFSPDDKYARQRYLLKKRFGLLPTQQPAPASTKVLKESLDGSSTENRFAECWFGCRLCY